MAVGNFGYSMLGPFRHTRIPPTAHTNVTVGLVCSSIRLENAILE